MASTKFTGLAPIKNHKVQYTITAAAATGSFVLTAGGASLSYTPGSSTIETAIDAIVALFSDTNRPLEFSVVTATKDASDKFTLAMPSSPSIVYSQRPLGITRSVTGTGCSWTESTVQAPSGPQWWSVAANWSNGTPSSSNDCIVENWTGDLLYGLEDLAAQTPSGIVIRGLRGALGLPLKHPQLGWTEWLPRYCKIKPTILDIGTPSGIVVESGLLRFDLDDAAATVTVNNTGTSIETGREALILKGSAIARLKCFRGSIGVATDPGDEAEMVDLLVGSAAARTGAAGLLVRTSAGVTITGDATHSDGLWECYNAPDNPISFLGGEFVPNQFDPSFNVATSVPFRVMR